MFVDLFFFLWSSCIRVGSGVVGSVLMLDGSGQKSDGVELSSRAQRVLSSLWCHTLYR